MVGEGQGKGILPLVGSVVGLAIVEYIPRLSYVMYWRAYCYAAAVALLRYAEVPVDRGQSGINKMV